MALGGPSRKQSRGSLLTQMQLCGLRCRSLLPLRVAAMDFRVFAPGPAVIREFDWDGSLHDLARAFRDFPREDGMRASTHPPVVEFVRVNRPASDIQPGGPTLRRFHPPDSFPRYQPWNSAALVVSHHLDGLSQPSVLGLLRPRARQDSLRCSLA